MWNSFCSDRKYYTSRDMAPRATRPATTTAIHQTGVPGTHARTVPYLEKDATRESGSQLRAEVNFRGKKKE
jgi:hypothetical protein